MNNYEEFKHFYNRTMNEETKSLKTEEENDSAFLIHENSITNNESKKIEIKEKKTAKNDNKKCKSTLLTKKKKKYKSYQTFPAEIKRKVITEVRINF